MFSLFKKKPKGPKYKDIIWMNDKAKQLHFITFMKKMSAANKVFVVSAFEDSLQVLEQSLGTLHLNYIRLNSLDDITADVQMYALHSSVLQQNYAIREEWAGGLILFLEHYPVYEIDVEQMQQAANQLRSDDIRFYLSLDSPLFSFFGGDRIKNMIMKMGGDDNDPLEHKMISASISNAQKKLSDKMTTEKKTSSEEEWYRVNVKS